MFLCIQIHPQSLRTHINMSSNHIQDEDISTLMSQSFGDNVLKKVLIFVPNF